jgi:hypothetical protein
MATQIKAVAFKTTQLQAIKEFFAAKLGFSIKESSPLHIVIHSRGLRILFVKSDEDDEVELYVAGNIPKTMDSPTGVNEDPTPIKIIQLKNSICLKIKVSSFPSIKFL